MSRRSKLLMRALRRHEKSKRKRSRPRFYKTLGMQLLIGGVPYDITGISAMHWDAKDYDEEKFEWPARASFEVKLTTFIPRPSLDNL